ncbi:hypothetical protein BDY24DRAFT_53418 [Mrakia frigida]|uniref:zinc finger Ran-binding domain-containing protein n=1 Tax=Mrakia frigida TaxID=29902 RepID=UPI003FCC016E
MVVVGGRRRDKAKRKVGRAGDRGETGEQGRRTLPSNHHFQYYSNFHFPSRNRLTFLPQYLRTNLKGRRSSTPEDKPSRERTTVENRNESAEMDDGTTSKTLPSRPWDDDRTDNFDDGGAQTNDPLASRSKGKGREVQPLPPILKKREREEIVIDDDSDVADEGYWSTQSEVFGEGWRTKVTNESDQPLTLPELVALSTAPPPLRRWKAIKPRRRSTTVSSSSQSTLFHSKPPSYPPQKKSKTSSSTSARHVAFDEPKSTVSPSVPSPLTPPTSDSDFEIFDPHQEGTDESSSSTTDDEAPRPSKKRKQKQPSSSSSASSSRSKPPSYPPPPAHKRPITLSSSPEPEPIRRYVPVPLSTTTKTSKAPVKPRSKPSHNSPQRLGGGFVPPPPELAGAVASGSGGEEWRGGKKKESPWGLEIEKGRSPWGGGGGGGMRVAGPSQPKSKPKRRLDPYPQPPIARKPKVAAPPPPVARPQPQSTWPPRAPAVVAPPSQWSCPSCTFFNDNALWECSMCETARP